MAKQVLFGYRVTDGSLDADTPLIDSGDPHLTTRDDALNAARLIAKHRVSHNIRWTLDGDGELYGTYVPADDVWSRTLLVEVTTREVAL